MPSPSQTSSRGARVKYRVGVDTGGTFTDLILLGDDGQLLRRKVLSTPDDFSRGILQALTAAMAERGIEGSDLREFIHGTTVATNAILEAKGPTVGLLTTRGFRDVLEIGRGTWGADVHDLRWVKPAALVARANRREIDERLSAQGEVLRAPERAQVERELAFLHQAGIRHVAVCLLNSYVDPRHEQLVREVGASAFPDMNICCSTDVLGEAREYERTSTTVINTYLMPVVDSYLRGLQQSLVDAGYLGPVLVMQSNGGLIGADIARRKPVHIVESGPAAGVLAACYLASETGERNLIAFDMGGTTAKATLIEQGQPFESAEYYVGGGMSHANGSGHVIRVPSIEIAEVGAGGGSIAWLDAGGALRVGPHSAGAAPGPACYAQGGSEPTTTDAYAAMGYLNPRSIAGGAKGIEVAPANEAIARVIGKPGHLETAEAAHGIHAVATSNMIRAIRAVSVERGRDARDYTLVAFGGAGPLHAAALGRTLGLKRVLIPNSPGLFSALGLLMADVQQKFTRTVLQRTHLLDHAAAARLARVYAELQDAAQQEMLIEGRRPEELRLQRSATMQYLGQSFELLVDIPLQQGDLNVGDWTRLAQIFCDEHQRTYGYQEDAARVQIVSLRVTASVVGTKCSYAEVGRQSMQAFGDASGSESSSRRAYFGPDAGWMHARVLRRGQLLGASVEGPAIVEELDTTVVVPPQCSVSLDAVGNLVLTLQEGAPDTVDEATINAASLELVKNSLESITDNMARTLARTARSLIVRDSHDFSVALCNAQGELVSGGVGIAVHLGSIPNAVGSLPAELRQGLVPGDLLFMNDPYAGGMHLPDIFIFKPLFLEGRLEGFAAAVAHMADVGGRVPGGNAADSTEIFQEGVRIPPTKLYSAGRLNESVVSLLCANVRQPDLLMADLHAEIAACNTAQAEFDAIARRLGPAALRNYMSALIDYGERMGRDALRQLTPGRYSFVDHIDDDGVGGPPVRIQVCVDVSPDGIAVDFDGTAAQVRSAINAPIAITRAAVAYVVKAIIGREIPNNSGFLRLLRVSAPPASVVNMAFPAACAARAVTAYRVTDALLGAFAPLRPDRVPAAGDGGPAVISCGGEDTQGRPFVFMELISGAFGGRPGLDGLEGVAMPIVNALNTSCELIEATYPLRIEHYGFVPDSGGAGRHRGGLAVRRDVRFLGRRAVLQIRSDRAIVRPWGLAGGQPGCNSRNSLFLPDSSKVDLPSKIVTEIFQGTIWRHITASGGGWGQPAERASEDMARDRREEKASLAQASAKAGRRAPGTRATPARKRRSASV